MKTGLFQQNIYRVLFERLLRCVLREADVTVRLEQFLIVRSFLHTPKLSVQSLQFFTKTKRDTAST